MPRPDSYGSFVALALALLLTAFGTACAQDAETPEEASAAPAADGAPPTLTSRGADDTTGAPAADGPAAEGAAIQAPGATFNLPGAWEQQTPSSSMRLAQAAIPGDAGPGELTVFYFGPGGGGGVEANLQRWVGQVETSAEPTREVFSVGGYSVTWISVEGTIKPSTMGVGPTEPQPGSRLLGAVVEGPQGPWFFKATGPSATIESARDDFLAMLRSVRSPA